MDFPSKDGLFGQVKIRILTASEEASVRSRAQKVAKEFCGTDARAGDLGYEQVYADEAAFELVCLACRNVANDNEPAFLHPKLARNILTTDEIALLLRAYNMFRVEAGPMLSELTPAEMEAWIEKLREGGSRLPLSSLGSEALTDLVMHLVAKLPISPTGNGSPGSPHDENSSGSSEPGVSDLVDAAEVER